MLASWKHQKVKLHISYVYISSFAQWALCESFSFGFMSFGHTASSDFSCSASVFLATAQLSKWQSERPLTKKVMWRTQRSCSFPPFKMKGVASCRGMPRLKWASSICGCVMVWKNNCAAPYKEAVCTLITLLMLLWQAAVMGREVNAS